jgi:acyl-CoA synthetase (AMP-forming)/AMP-acid ligase II
VNLTDLLDRSARGRGVVHFLREDGRGADEVSVASLWSDAAEAGDWLVRTVGRGGAVAALLTASPACVATVLGAWRRGLTLVSLPTPAKGMAPAEYQVQVETMCKLVGAEHLMVDARYLPLIPPTSVAVHPFDDCLVGATSSAGDEPGALIQFTSGSTNSPRGVRLTLEAVAQNILAILEVLDPQGDEVVCSWLPLSHDMGFIGMLLGSLVATGPDFGGRTDLVIMRPEQFLANPTLWLRACSEFAANVTAVPNFALDLAVRTIGRAGPLDLRSFKSLIVGGERVKADTLRRFEQAVASAGLPATALCPSYGLAEATLAVSMSRPDEPWRSVRVDAHELAESRWVPTGSDGAELVANGSPVGHVRCRVAPRGAGDIGELLVASPSLLESCVGGPTKVDDGWLATGDLGHIDERGETFVVARADDVIVSRGRNLYGTDLAAVAEQVHGVRPGNCVAVPDENGTYAIVAEPRASVSSLHDVAADVRTALAKRFGVAPSTVVFVVPGTLPKTPSGKSQAYRVRALLANDQLDVDTRVEFGARVAAGA